MYMLEHGQRGRELNAISYQPLMDILAKYFRKKYDKSEGDAEAIARDILNHLRERTYILAEVGKGIFGFVHRTFMEYFAACHCKAKFNSSKSDYDWLTKKIFGVYWQRDDWQEVLLLLFAMLADQKSPIREVVDYLYEKCQVDPSWNIIFSARCLWEVGNIKNLRKAQNLATEKVVEVIVTHVTKFQENHDSEFVNAGITAISMLDPMIDITPRMETIIRNLDDCETLPEQIVAWLIKFALRSKLRPEYLEFAFNPAYIDTQHLVAQWLYNNQWYLDSDADFDYSRWGQDPDIELEPSIPDPFQLGLQLHLFP